MAGVNREVSKAWAWGNITAIPSPTGSSGTGGGAAYNDVVNSTGAGSAYGVHGTAREHSFYIETDPAATCSYQIRTSRTATSPSVVLSSGTLSTGQLDLVQLTGPLLWVSPRIKTLGTGGSASTAVGVVIRLVGN